MDDTTTASAADARVDELWATLDMRKQGQLDLAGLKKGLRKLDHRTLCGCGQTGRCADRTAALKNADQLLNEVMKAVDTDADGRITYKGGWPRAHMAMGRC
jgi:solute carrier family 25 phosphate transporter 23/24/25/41